jgi:indoleacetamide hydrolase
MRDHPRIGSTRRRFLGAAAIVPLAFRGRAAGTQADLMELEAGQAIERIRRGELKAEAYGAELLKQYNAHEDLNLVTSIDTARVLEAARSVDRDRARGARLGRAAGLPFAVKDQIEVAGYPVTCGNAALKGYLPKRNAVVVDRLAPSPSA